MEHTDEELDAFAEWEQQAWTTRAIPYAAEIVQLTRGGAGFLLDAAEVGPGSRLLDVATGPGVVAVAGKDRGANVIGVDQAQSMVEIARAAGVDARQAGVEQLPFNQGEFDAVVAGFLLNHLARPVEGVSEMARVCRGRVALSVWDLPELNLALGLYAPVVESLALSAVAPPGPDSHLFADRARFTALLSDAGLSDVTVTQVGWTLTVDPGAWFDAVAVGTPRTGAVLAAATPDQRAAARERYVAMATGRFGSADGLVTLPAAAVIGSGRSRP